MMSNYCASTGNKIAKEAGKFKAKVMIGRFGDEAPGVISCLGRVFEGYFA
jgi:hypothetical protein